MAKHTFIDSKCKGTSIKYRGTSIKYRGTFSMTIFTSPSLLDTYIYMYILYIQYVHICISLSISAKTKMLSDIQYVIRPYTLELGRNAYLCIFTKISAATYFLLVRKCFDKTILCFSWKSNSAKLASSPLSLTPPPPSPHTHFLVPNVYPYPYPPPQDVLL